MTRLYADGKCIDEILDDDDYDPPAWEKANCRNCGAPLARGQVKCEYCGTSRQVKKQRLFCQQHCWGCKLTLDECRQVLWGSK